MKKTVRHHHPPLSIEAAPAEFFMNFEAFLPNSETRVHQHEWGQLVIIRGGIFEINAEGVRFLAPPHLAIWIPPNVNHKSYNCKPLEYCSLNISLELAKSLPKFTSLLNVTPIISAIVEDFRQRGVIVAKSKEDQNLVQVLFDQIAQQKPQQHFLPSSDNKFLQPILQAVEEDPMKDVTLQAWADKVHTTERTLARYCQHELGMSFTEWRLRVRYLFSLELLRKGQTVKKVALT